MNIGEQNRQFLREQAPKVYKALYEDPPVNPGCSIVTPEHGKAFMKGTTLCYIDSLYDQRAEREDIFRGAKEDTHIVIFMGRITIEVARYIKRKFPKAYQLVFIEPNQELFMEYLEEHKFMDIVTCVSPLSITIFCNIQIGEIVSVLRKEVMKTNKIEFFSQVSYNTVFNDYYRQIIHGAVEQIGLEQIGLNTELMYSSSWLEMILKNKTMETFAGNDLNDFFADKPLMIVAAGPSLKKNIHLLQEAKNKVILFAVGTAAQILYRHGIKPHFNVFIDVNQMDFVEESRAENIDFSDVPLLYTLQAQYEAVLQAKTRFSLILASDYLNRYLIKKQGRNDLVVDSGPSVANMLFSYFCKINAKAIIFVGQDFCMYGDQLYAFGKSKSQTSNFITRQDINGQTVLVNPGYYSMKEWFDHYRTLFPEQVAFNSTEGGLGIAGIDNVPLAEVLAKFEEFDRPVSELLAAHIAEKEMRWTNHFAELELPVLQEELVQVETVAKDMQNLLQKLLFMKKNNANIAKMEAIVRRLENRRDKLLQNTFFAEVVLQTIKELVKVIEKRYTMDCLRATKLEKIEARSNYFVTFIAEIQGYCKSYRELYERAGELLAVGTEPHSGEAAADEVG